MFNNKLSHEIKPKLSVNSSLIEHTHTGRFIVIYLTSDIKLSYQTAQRANKTNYVFGQFKRSKCWKIQPADSSSYIWLVFDPIWIRQYQHGVLT